MTQTKLLCRSTALSFVLHVAAFVAICYVPVSRIERFSTSGNRQIIAIEMTMAAAAPAASASAMSVEVVYEPMKVDPPLLAEPPNRVEPQTPSIPPTSKLSVDQSNLPPVERLEPPASVSPTIPVLHRPDQPVELPKIAELQVTRPRRIPSVSITPNASTAPLESVAGLKETQVQFLSNPPPKYPTQAVVNRTEGTVLLKLHIDHEGQVQRAEILSSSGSKVLDEAARSAVLTWSGKPATRQGRAIASEEVLPVRFRL